MRHGARGARRLLALASFRQARVRPLGQSFPRLLALLVPFVKRGATRFGAARRLSAPAAAAARLFFAAAARRGTRGATRLPRVCASTFCRRWTFASDDAPAIPTTQARQAFAASRRSSWRSALASLTRSRRSWACRLSYSDRRRKTTVARTQTFHAFEGPQTHRASPGAAAPFSWTRPTPPRRGTASSATVLARTRAAPSSRSA